MRVGLRPVTGRGPLASANRISYATTTINSNGSQIEVNAHWFMDDGSGTFVHGSVFARKVKGGESHLDFFEGTSTPLVCDDGSPGAHHEFISGSGPATVAVDNQYRTGTANGVVELFVVTFDECFGPFASPSNDGGGISIGVVAISIDAVGTSAISMSRSSSGFHVPSEVNESSRFDTRSRSGTADVVWGDNERSGDATIGKISWRFHSNS